MLRGSMKKIRIPIRGFRVKFVKCSALTDVAFASNVNFGGVGFDSTPSLGGHYLAQASWL
jgi:hypothetical protein